MAQRHYSIFGQFYISAVKPVHMNKRISLVIHSLILYGLGVIVFGWAKILRYPDPPSAWNTPSMQNLFYLVAAIFFAYVVFMLWQYNIYGRKRYPKDDQTKK